MKQPIKAGDLAEVISGMLGKDSPNIGLVVRVINRVFDCSTYGIIWRCDAEYAVRGPSDVSSKVPMKYTDFAQDWLRKIEPPLEEPKAKVTEKELEH